ncbi:hypothetical protein M0804_012623 [Polistes exclamans]|nr:hypothetical protein M0804_012623 [Polistes exclamans]
MKWILILEVRRSCSSADDSYEEKVNQETIELYLVKFVSLIFEAASLTLHLNGDETRLTEALNDDTEGEEENTLTSASAKYLEGHSSLINDCRETRMAPSELDEGGRRARNVVLGGNFSRVPTVPHCHSVKEAQP